MPDRVEGPRPESADGLESTEPADAELLSRLQSGDEEAFHELFKRHTSRLQARLYRDMPRGLRRKFSIADLLQETRIVGLQRFRQHDEWPEGTFGAWITRIARNKLRDAVRRYEGTVKRGAAQEISRGERPDTALFQAKGTSPSEAAGRADMRRYLLELMDQLPEDYASVLRLVWLDQLSLEEVADKLGRSREATKKLCARALARFTALYKAKVTTTHD